METALDASGILSDASSDAASQGVSTILTQLIRNYSLEKFLSAVTAFLICLILVKLTLKIVSRVLEHTKLEQRAKLYINSGLKIILYIIMAVIVVQSLGIDMTSFVALLSVFSLGIALAAEEVLGNLAGGLVIVSSHPFKIGDIMESSGHIGVVQEINFYYTKLLNIDGQYIYIPNKELASSRVINYSALGRRRITVKIFAAYDASTLEVKGACHYALDMTENILKDPAPMVQLTAYGSNAIEYSIFCWVIPSDFLSVTYALNENLREAFARTGVEMTYDHLNVHIIENRSGKTL